MFVFYDWPFPHMRTLQRMQPISLLILGSVFSDCVVFYGNCRKVHRNNNDVVDIVTPSPVWCCFWRISLSMRRGVKSVIPFGQSLSVLFRVAYSWPWYANMTSSIKPETHSVPQRRHRTIELRPLVKCTKFGGDRTCSSGDMLADRQTHADNWHTDTQTDMLITILTPHAGGGEIRRTSWGTRRAAFATDRSSSLFARCWQLERMPPSPPPQQQQQQQQQMRLHHRNPYRAKHCYSAGNSIAAASWRNQVTSTICGRIFHTARKMKSAGLLCMTTLIMTLWLVIVADAYFLPATEVSLCYFRQRLPGWCVDHVCLLVSLCSRWRNFIDRIAEKFGNK